jgi:hypothetical protein
MGLVTREVPLVLEDRPGDAPGERPPALLEKNKNETINRFLANADIPFPPTRPCTPSL